MAAESLTLVVNPGSASHKYALFAGEYEWARIHFEFIDGRVVGTINHAGEQQSESYDDIDLSAVAHYVLPLLHKYRVIGNDDTVSMIGIRVVAPGNHFVKDQLVTEQTVVALRAVQQRAPLHVTTVLSELEHLETYFPGIPIVAISDSAFHATKPAWAAYYGINIELAEEAGIKRYGYQGISVSSVVRSLAGRDTLLPKTIVCHLGSGSSITALIDGQSIDNTMGYSPLEGLVMSSRSGNIDIAAALAIKRQLQLSDECLEEYLNKQSGLLGISGSSNDVRQLRASEDSGDERAQLALKMFVYRIQQAIGQMAASLGGVDCVVFTATIGERSTVIRQRVVEGLGFLGFELDSAVNDQTFEPTETVNIGTDASKPIFVISTDEAAEIARRTEQHIHEKTLKN
ncbi:acetate/propionate family kinase [Candidatus Saccharibacteria bacterium]|nr:acetate/propionate family kinase [Candidatus Saccharibacteria bacterium]